MGAKTPIKTIAPDYHTLSAGQLQVFFFEKIGLFYGFFESPQTAAALTATPKAAPSLSGPRLRKIPPENTLFPWLSPIWYDILNE